MNQNIDLPAEFTPVSKADWLARIAKDLKGKPLEDLYWHLDDDVVVDPFGHADDSPVPPDPLQDTAVAWEINEDVEESDPAAARRQALEALAFGAESLYFHLPAQQELAALDDRMRGIYLDHISLHFGGPAVTEAPAAALAALGNLAQQQGVSTQALCGSLYYDPAGAPGRIQDWRYLTEMLDYARQQFPGFRCISVDGRPAYQGARGVTGELAAVLRQGQVYLEQLVARDWSAGDAAAQMQFTWYIGKSYFVEIAKLRAFKLLWINILKAWGAAAVYPVLDVRLAPGDYTDDLYTNMIRATTMAMSAVLGGADRLTVLPYDAGREAESAYPPTFARRIARNVQHLLKLESGFGDMADPAAGSYAIEKLTAQLAQAAWEKFRKA